MMSAPPSDDQHALARIRESLPRLDPTIQQSIHTSLNNGAPPTQILQWLQSRGQPKATEHHVGQHMQQQQPQLLQQIPGQPSHNSETDTAAQQMAALSNASRKRGIIPPIQPPPFPGNAGPSRPGTSSGPQHQTGSFHPSVPPPQPPGPNMQSRSNPARQQFLKMLNDMMISSGHPLPPSLTGIENPTFDATKSRFGAMDIPNEGCIRLAGKTVDLQELFSTAVQRLGGSAKITQLNQWPTLAAQLGLPEFTSVPNNTVPIPVVNLLQSYYQGVLGLFEDWYLKQQQQKVAMRHQQQQHPPGPPIHPTAGMNKTHAPVPPSGSVNNQQPGVRMPVGMPGDIVGAVDSPEALSQKRKLAPYASPEKRPRLALQEESRPGDLGVKPPQSPTLMPTEALRDILPDDPLPSADQRRLKIEYVPISRPLDTIGGRRLEAIEQQLAVLQQRRVVRHHDELGMIDLESVVMSLRSGLGNEVSYALTTLTMLSTLTISKGGFQIERCPELLESLIDLIEDKAFDNEEEDGDDDGPLSSYQPRIWSRSDITRQIDDETCISAARRKRRTPEGPGQEPDAVIITILNLIRNLSLIASNAAFMTKDPRLVDTLARMAEIIEDTNGSLRPASNSLELVDMLRIHSEVQQILSILAPTLDLTIQQPRTTRRIFTLILSPLADFDQLPRPAQGGIQDRSLPPSLIETTLEVFSRLAQSDRNRKVLARYIDHGSIIHLFGAFLRLLPFTDNDLSVTVGSNAVLEPWMGYLERTMLCIYTVVFLAPPPLKAQLRKVPGVTFIILRVIRFYLGGIRYADRATFASPQYDKNGYTVLARRAFECLRLLDAVEDSFEPVLATPLAFAPPSITTGSPAENTGAPKKEPHGLLSGHFTEMVNSFLAREGMEEVVFAELEAMIRLQEVR